MIGMDLSVEVAHGIDGIDAQAWDTLSAGRAFSSFAWYQYGERAMTGCRPLYIIVRQGARWVARGSFWLIPNEPLPTGSIAQPWSSAIQACMRAWPLLICRSPFGDTSGLILPEPPLRGAALQAILAAARDFARSARASFLVFDYLDAQQSGLPDWPERWTSLQLADPGTVLPITWDSYDAYLQSLSKSAWKDYRRQANQAARMRLEVSAGEPVGSLTESLPLIRAVEQVHGSLPKPWAEAMLQNAVMLPSTWITARIDERLVGCGLLLQDRGVFLATLLGLDYTCSYVYFQILYRAIRETICQGGCQLRAGSGAYALKQRLGLQLEGNNYLRFAGQNRLLNGLGRLARST
jgi:hypothetical protein